MKFTSSIKIKPTLFSLRNDEFSVVCHLKFIISETKEGYLVCDQIAFLGEDVIPMYEGHLIKKQAIVEMIELTELKKKPTIN